MNNHTDYTSITNTFKDVDQPQSADTLSAAACVDGTIEFVILDTVNTDGSAAYLSLSHADAQLFAAQIVLLTKGANQ